MFFALSATAQQLTEEETTTFPQNISTQQLYSLSRCNSVNILANERGYFKNIIGSDHKMKSDEDICQAIKSDPQFAGRDTNDIVKETLALKEVYTDHKCVETLPLNPVIEKTFSNKMVPLTATTVESGEALSDKKITDVFGPKSDDFYRIDALCEHVLSATTNPKRYITVISNQAEAIYGIVRGIAEKLVTIYDCRNENLKTEAQKEVYAFISDLVQAKKYISFECKN